MKRKKFSTKFSIIEEIHKEKLSGYARTRGKLKKKIEKVVSEVLMTEFFGIHLVFVLELWLRSEPTLPPL